MKITRIRRKGTGEGFALREKLLSGGISLPVLECPAFSATGLCRHLFSTRFGGVSEGPFTSMNLGISRGDEDEKVRENYRRISEALDVPVDRFVFSMQTHSLNVRRVTEEDAGKGLSRERDYRDVDGLISNVPGLVLCVFWADCIPVLLLDPVRRAVGAVHSGWRGTVGKIAARAVREMGEAYGSNPEDIIAAVGPGICGDCYEVSEDVAEAFQEAFPSEKARDSVVRPAMPSPSGNFSGRKYYVDLWEANRLILMEAGLLERNIHISGICTKCNPDVFFSHRQMGERRGLNAAFLALEEPV